MYNSHEYELKTEYSKADKAFVCKVTEFPSLACHGDTAFEAESEMKMLLTDILFDLELSGEEIPVPLIFQENA